MLNDQSQTPTQSSTSPDGALPQAGNISASKRKLLKAAWVAPVIIAVSLPKSSFAANVSGGGGGTIGGFCQKPRGPIADVICRLLGQ